MSKLKRLYEAKKRLNEYDGGGDASGWWGGPGSNVSSDELLDALAGPFIDALKITTAEIEKVGHSAVAMGKAIVDGMGPIFIKGFESRYDLIAAKRDAEIDSINKKYKEAYDSVNKTFDHEDFRFFGFISNPIGYIGVKLAKSTNDPVTSVVDTLGALINNKSAVRKYINQFMVRSEVGKKTLSLQNDIDILKQQIVGIDKNSPQYAEIAHNIQLKEQQIEKMRDQITELVLDGVNRPEFREKFEQTYRKKKEYTDYRAAIKKAFSDYSTEVTRLTDGTIHSNTLDELAKVLGIDKSRIDLNKAFLKDVSASEQIKIEDEVVAKIKGSVASSLMNKLQVADLRAQFDNLSHRSAVRENYKHLFNMLKKVPGAVVSRYHLAGKESRLK